MYKKLIIGCLLGMLVAVPAYAHLTGAFANFLAIVYDDSTIAKLQEDMEKTRVEIEMLKPQVRAAEEAFRVDQAAATEQLQFYSEVGLDTWLALMQDGVDIVDLMGSQWLVSRKIDGYLDELNELYRQYQQLLSSQRTLEGHEELLRAIEKNLLARQAFLEENAGLELEVIANYLDIDWTAEVEDHIIADLQRDADRVSTQLLDWVEQKPSTPHFLSESWLNDESNARYYFRNDHVYVEYELEFAHVLVLGQVLQNEAGDAAQLVIEAGFYNGFFLPEELLVELPGFVIDYEPLTQLEGMDEPYIIQSNGGLQLYTK
ncbi:MAG: hypothetical protein ABS948_01860 [Solibacillus sp.]